MLPRRPKITVSVQIKYFDLWDKQSTGYKLWGLHTNGAESGEKLLEIIQIQLLKNGRYYQYILMSLIVSKEWEDKVISWKVGEDRLRRKIREKQIVV